MPAAQQMSMPQLYDVIYHALALGDSTLQIWTSFTFAVIVAVHLAGDRIAGGVGTHETALPSPEVIDLGGRSVLPGFSDSHVHFPTWSLARRDVTLDGASSVAECLERVRAHPRHGDWIRGTGWRSATWEIQPTRQALDEVAGSTPVAL